MIIIIEKRKNHEHIVIDEYKETYGEFEESFAKEHIYDVVNEFETYVNNNGDDLQDANKKEINEVVNLVPNDYYFDCGDFTYYITIEK